MRPNEANAALATIERLLLIEAQGLLLDTDASFAAVLGAPGVDVAAARELGERASEVQHAWAGVMRRALAEVRVRRATLGEIVAEVSLAPSAARGVSDVALRALGVAESYVAVAADLSAAARALAVGDLGGARAALASAEGPASAPRAAPPRPAGSAAPSPTTPCDPDETPRDCRARQEGERAAARTAEEERRARTAATIRQFGDVVRAGLEAVDAATTGAADARNDANRRRLLVAGAEGDVALARSSQRVTVAATPAPTDPPVLAPTDPPATSSAPIVPRGAALALGIGLATTATVATVVGAVVLLRYRQSRQWQG